MQWRWYAATRGGEERENQEDNVERDRIIMDKFAYLVFDETLGPSDGSCDSATGIGGLRLSDSGIVIRK